MAEQARQRGLQGSAADGESSGAALVDATGEPLRRGHEQVTDRQRLIGLLDGLRMQRALLSVRVDERQATYNTALLKIDAPQGLMYLDELVPREGHERLQVGSTLRVTGVLNRLPTHFSSLVLATGVQKGIAYYRASIPESLDYKQRRAFYRAHVPRSQSIVVDLVAPDGQISTGRVVDISLGGFALMLPKHLSIEALNTFEVPALELPGQDPFGCVVQARYTLAEKGEPWIRVGVRFRELGPRERRVLARAILGFEREWIRKRARSSAAA